MDEHANQEQAEGSRGTVDPPDKQGSGEPDRADSSGENTGGITNRPLDAEIATQRVVPPRGDVKVPGRDHA